MKKILAGILSLAMVFTLIPSTMVSAQETVGKSSSNYKYEPIQISNGSLNGNTVNGKGESGKYLDTDGGFYARDYSSTNGYLPDDGKVTTSDGVPYQLSWTGNSPYVGNECIRIVGTKNKSNGDALVTAESRTMTLLTYGAYSKVYVLGTAAAFQSSTSSLAFTVTLTYTDGTNSSTTYTLYDWYGNPSQTEGYARYRRNDGYSGSYGNPILQSKAIKCDDTKLLKSITFAINAKSSVVNDKGYIYAGIYAVTGAVSADAPDTPSAASATEVGKDSFTANWNKVSGANGYVIDVSEYKDFRDANGKPSFVGQYNNYSVNGDSTTSLKISGLDKKKTYYYRVRSKNDSGQSLNSNVMSVTTVDHNHSWQYEENGNVIKAYCNDIEGTCNHRGEDNAVYLTLKLNGLDANNSITYSGKAYDGASVENNITSVTGASAGSIQYVGRDGTTYAESTTAPTNAGKYTAKVTISEKTASADFEIIKATINPSVTLDSWIYSGTAATPKVDGNTENADVTYAYKIKDAEDSTYTDVTVDELQKLAVGQYTLKATVAESTNYKGGSATCDFSITRAPIKNVSVTMTGWTYGSYDKNVNAPELGADSNPGNGDVTYTYYTDKDCITKTTAKDGAESDGAVPMNAGTYYVKASVAETDHYAAGEATTSFVVKTKAITATVSAESKVYDGTTDAKVTATVETGVKGESLTLTGLKGTFADKNAGSGKIVTIDSSHANATAGENTVASNYTISYPDTTETDITPCPVELTWSDTDLIYNGTEQSVTATVKNAVKGDSFTLTYNGNTQTEVKGNYIAEVTGLGNDNYTLEKATGISQNWSISYLEAPDAEISGEEGNNGWHVSAVTLKPEDGYQISTDKKTWSDSLGYDAQGEQEATYYLREIKTGYITDAKTTSFKIDTVAPTGEITIGTNKFKEFLNKVTFGHWFKDTVSVKIVGEDSTSGIDTIEYQKVGKNDKYDVNGKWVEDESLSITDKDKYVIYARLTDKAGKQTIINSDGIVVFTDSTAVKVINYTKTTKESVDAEVALNGNTVASVKNGEAVLVEGTDYTVSADKITFSGDYLDTLSAGTYTLAVSYNPQGETEYIDGDKPVESQITVNVSRQTATMEITEALDKEYNGLPADVKYVTNSNTEAKVEYKVDGKWQTEAPTHAGSYEVKVSVPENGDYTAASDSKTFTISKTDARISTMTSGVSIYGDAVNITATVSLVNGETYTGEIEYSYRLAGTDDAYTVGIPSKAGSYETKATVKAFGDYNGASAEGTWTVKQKEVTVSGITAKDKVYDGKAAAELDYSQAAFEGILANDTLTVSATGTFADSNVASEKSVMITGLTLGGKDAGNYELASEGQQTETTAQITAKDITATITPNGGTYEGTITPATAVLNDLVKDDDPEITLTYAGTANDGTVVNGTKAPTHAGTYTVTTSITDSNYNLLDDGASAEYVVAKAEPALSVSAIADKNYGDNAFELEVSHKGDGVKSYTSSNEKVATVDEDGKVSIIGAGKATLTVSFAESANYTADQKEVTITVKKVNHELVVKNLTYNVTYGDKAFKIAAEAGDNETAIKFTSKNKDVASVSEDGTVTVGNAGTAKITVSMDESNDYLAVSKEVTVNVAPKDVTVTVNDASKVYGDKDGAFTYEATGLVGKDTLSGITLTRAEGEDVGTYDITASEKKNANPNYEVTFKKGTFTITEKEIGLKWSDTELTYNGKAQKPAATATGLVGKDTCEVTVSGAQKDAGTYTATAVKLSNKNYKLPEQVTAAFEIGAKEIGIKWSETEFTYDGTAKLPTATATGLVDGDTCEIEVSGAATDAGTHTVKAEKVSNNNYKLPKEVETAYVINKADAVYGAPEAKEDLVYNGADQALITAGTTEDGTLMYKVGNGEWGTELPTGMNAGDYTVSYKVVGDDNHNDSEEGTVTITVAKAKVTVTANDAEKHVNKADPELYDTINGMIGMEQLKGVSIKREAGEAVGTYAINVTVDADANPNYDITTISGTFTINDHDWSGEWKTVKEATETENGKREKSCAYDGCEQKLYETIPATGNPEEPEKPGEGTLRKDAEVALDAPISEATLDNPKSELIKADGIFTEAEKEAISNGSNARVWLEITGVDMSTISKDDQAAMEAAAKEIMGENLNLTYFNADLFKQVDGTAKTQIHEPGTMIKVTVQIPEELLNHDKSIDREYKILRLHDGKVDVISGTFNADTNEFTFETDKFSTYAIAYGDTHIPVKPADTKSADNKTIGSGKEMVKNDATSAKAPKTDDPMNAAPWAVAALLAGCVAVITGKKRKQERR